jgi:hypothetical protein
MNEIRFISSPAFRESKAHIEPDGLTRPKNQFALIFLRTFLAKMAIHLP